jgi:tRNA(fMet)-specific endonuclease VapC
MLKLDTTTITYYFRGNPKVVPRLWAIRPTDLTNLQLSNMTRYALMRMPPKKKRLSYAH